jgi:hypothetical protein
LIVDYTGASPIASIHSLMKIGYDGGSWNGDGIASSTTAATPGRAMGLVEATDIGSPATFLGVPIDATSVLVGHTLSGDANLDLIVNITDFALLAANFNTPSYWARGDFNYSGLTDIADFAMLAANFNQALDAEPARASFIPEPQSALLVTISALLLNRCRRRGSRVLIHGI